MLPQPVARRDGPAGPGPSRQPDHALRVALVCTALALLVRLALLASPFGRYDGDAAVNALVAQDLLHGRHLWLVWPGQVYAGTLDAALQALSIRVLGVGQVAVGLPLAVVGAATVGLLSWTAGRFLRAPGAALAVGLAASVYPLWLLIWGTAVGGGGYAVSSLLALGALSIALVRRPLGRGAAAAVGGLCGLALWSQPLSASQVAVAALVALLGAPAPRRRALAAVMAAAAVPGLLVWVAGVHDGTDRTLSPLQDTLGPRTVLGPHLLAERARALHGPIADKALGLVAGDGPPLVPVGAVRLVVALVMVAVPVALVVTLVRRSPPLVPALLGVLVLSAVLFVLFPPSLDTVQAARNVGVPRPLGVPRYVFPGMYAASVLAGLAAWGLLRRGGPARVAGAALALAVLLSSVLSARALLEPGAYARSRPSTGALQAFAGDLHRAGARCVVAGYWDVYPLALASDERLRGESTFVNRMGVVCGSGPGVATIFPRPGGVASPAEAEYAAAHPGARTVAGPALVAYLT